MAKAAIVIVCMNNLKNLFPCLDSIKEHTKISYEVWVVAYFFSKGNLKLLREKYPWVIVVESNEIRGFSENNNLALIQVQTEYTLVLNDDTLFKEPVLDELVDAMEKTPEAKVMSPYIQNLDGSKQFNGRNPRRWFDFILGDSFGVNLDMKPSKYVDQNGIYQTYNLMGACFLIKQDYFRSLNFFDEYYFFCPEDIALSTLINQKGDECYVDAESKVVHLGGGTRISPVKVATLPAARKGGVYFYSQNIWWKKFILSSVIIVFSMLKMIYFATIKRNKIEFLAQWHSIIAMFSYKTPKELFTKFYLDLKNKK